jgi:hypothetical protein
VLALVGIFGARLRSLPWLAGVVLFFLLAQSDGGRHSGLFVLRYLPLTRQIDLPARLTIGFWFCTGVLAALGADSLCRLNWRWATGIAVALLAAGLVDSWMVGPPNLRYMFHNRIEPLPKAVEFHQWFVGNPGNQTEIALANMGSANCDGYGYNSILTTVTARNNPTDISYRGEYYLLGSGRVLQTRWTPN